MKSIIIILSFTLALSSSLPTAIFHGLGDACIYPGMHHLTKEIGKQTGAHAECIEIGEIGTETSWFWNFEKQARTACDKLLNNTNFNNTRFNVMGLS